MRKTLLAATVGFLAAAPALAAEDVMVVFDGSNSMWGQIDGTAKIEIAREAMDSLMGDWTEGTNVGLMAYGHRREADCKDIETLIEPGPYEREAFFSKIQGISPRGKTPLTDSIEQAAETLAYRDNPATLVVITDGIETCRRDPCALADDLERMGVGFTAHVVGFDLKDEEQDAVACIAERTGGRFLPAGDAAELGTALSKVGATVAKTPEPEPEPEPAPEVELTAPETADSGASLPVSWQAETQQPKDYITIVPAGAEEGSYTNYFRVKEENEGSLRAPGETGLFEVRYIRDEDDSTLASAEIEITDPEVTVSAPESAITGEAFSVSWTGNVHPKDYVTIVPMGAEEGAYTDYTRVKEDSEGQLQAPAETGVYEVRYVLDEGGRTLASDEIEITEPDVTVSAPENATAGATFEISWTGNVHPRDYVTIVPMGAADDEYMDYVRVNDDNEGKLQAPAETGLYEVRYVLNEGRKPLASVEIEITEPEATVSAPEKATAGSTFEISWTGNIHPRDYVTIVPMGAEEDAYMDYVRVNNDNAGKLQAPAETGLYEVRYILNEGRQSLASTEIEITEPEATVSAPGSAIVGSSFPVSWTGNVHPRDYVTIVPMGAEDDAYLDYVRVNDDNEGKLQAPAETGLYEVRYILNEGRQPLASTEIEIVEAGMELSGPDTIRAGDEITVSWSGTVPHPRDYVTVVPMGAEEGSYGEYERVQSKDEAKLPAPAETGMYEIRYILNEGKRTLARHMLEVVDETAALDTGGSLEVPETAAAGETIEISWSADTESGDQRIALAQADQADFTWIEVQSASDGPPLSFTLPEEAGRYEFRLLDIPGRKVLSRAIIDVQ
ncbi:VWA domain-containing protein [Fodinicurvata sediminis]|uniref:VWA domain-containing protein n=1 Tax=Fodinicurvata sediminis TaxID=1121832 RepID=UPI0004292BBC|nr:VWA domain-containing protein [Fodinicurvata sediminis]